MYSSEYVVNECVEISFALYFKLVDVNEVENYLLSRTTRKSGEGSRVIFFSFFCAQIILMVLMVEKDFFQIFVGVR